MAKRKPKRKFRKYLRGQIEHNAGLGTLAAKTLVGANIGDTVTEKAWISSVKASWSLNQWTPGPDDGPILVGVAHSDYSDAEIEEWIENTSSWEAHDLVQQEVAKRKIREVGTFPTPADANEALVLNNGKPIWTKCGWMLGTGQTVKIWAYNKGASALGTTEPNLGVSGFANLWPA